MYNWKMSSFIVYYFTGKTPFAGQVAKMSRTWLGDTAVVAARFLGSSIQAEQILPALRCVPGVIVRLS